MMEIDILSKNDTYHAINPAYPDTCCIHHLRYRSTYPYPLSSVVLELFFFQNLYLPVLIYVLLIHVIHSNK